MAEPTDRGTRDILVGPAPVVEGTEFYTDSWAVIVGIDSYKNQDVPRLSCAVNDANSVEKTVGSLGFPPQRVFKRLNEEATKSGLERIFESELFKHTRPGDRVLFFFAGHGETVETGYGQEGFILPWDADPDELAFTAISMPGFRQMARRLKAKHVLLVADACYSEGFVSRSVAAPSKLLRAHLEERAIEVITAGTAKEKVVEEGEHGLFTRNFLSALRGTADEAGVGYLTAMQLAAWVQPRVIRDTEGEQHPAYGSLEGNGQFVFVLPQEGPSAPAATVIPPEPPKPRIKKVRLSGKIALRSEVAGQIYLDGESLGEAIEPGEVAELDNIPVGRHEVGVQGESGMVSQTILVREKETTEVNLKAPAEPSRIEVPKPLKWQDEAKPEFRLPAGLVPVKGCQVDPASGLPMEVICEADGAPMVLVSAGEFLMGSADDDEDASGDEKPQRRVYLDAFYIDKYPVTNAQFRKFAKPEADYGKEFNGDKQPVVGVTWEQANDYCNSVGKRLPTEAEWEKAARGVDGRKYPWRNEWDGSKVIWEKNSGERTHPVDRTYNTHRSPYGAVDMSGNVWQWVADWYDEHYYRSAPDRNPQGPASGQYRVLRGGSWDFGLPRDFRAAYRLWNLPDVRFLVVGFRCAKASK